MSTVRPTRRNFEAHEGATSLASFPFTGEVLTGAKASLAVLSGDVSPVLELMTQEGSPPSELNVDAAMATIELRLSPDQTRLLASTVRTSGLLRYQLDIEFAGSGIGVRRYIGEVSVVFGIGGVGEDTQLDFAAPDNSGLMLGGWI